MTAHDPTQKEMATGKKEERINQAEMNKQATHDRNTAIHQGGGTGTGRPHYSNSTTGATGHSTGSHQMSALPGHGTGEPMGQVTDGVVQSHPIGTATGTQRASAAHNTHVGGGVNQGYGTGGNYSQDIYDLNKLEMFGSKPLICCLRTFGFGASCLVFDKELMFYWFILCLKKYKLVKFVRCSD